MTPAIWAIWSSRLHAVQHLARTTARTQLNCWPRPICSLTVTRPKLPWRIRVCCQTLRSASSNERPEHPRRKTSPQPLSARRRPNMQRHEDNAGSPSRATFRRSRRVLLCRPRKDLHLVKRLSIPTRLNRERPRTPPRRRGIPSATREALPQGCPSPPSRSLGGLRIQHYQKTTMQLLGVAGRQPPARISLLTEQRPENVATRRHQQRQLGWRHFWRWSYCVLSSCSNVSRTSAAFATGNAATRVLTTVPVLRSSAPPITRTRCN